MEVDGCCDLYAVPIAGRQLRVVLNTNDPDYEHIYSIESYSDPQEEDADLTPTSILANGT